MLVSICTIARNEEGYLPHLLDDITKQDFPAGQIEVVMVDSGSKDGTRGIMLKNQKTPDGYFVDENGVWKQ